MLRALSLLLLISSSAALADTTLVGTSPTVLARRGVRTWLVVENHGPLPVFCSVGDASRAVVDQGISVMPYVPVALKVATTTPTYCVASAAQTNPAAATNTNEVDDVVPIGNRADVTGSTVGLTQSSTDTLINGLNAPACTDGSFEVLTLTTTPQVVPVAGLVNRTHWHLTNLENNHEVWCLPDPGDASAPTSTTAIVIEAHGAVDRNVDSAQDVRCRCASSTCRVNVWGTSCKR